jgi:hypothetical protein
MLESAVILKKNWKLQRTERVTHQSSNGVKILVSDIETISILTNIKVDANTSVAFALTTALHSLQADQNS